MHCNLAYIPKRLHSFNKDVVKTFTVGEELYYRCNLEECSKPYQKISLYDVSHNRNFNNSKNYPKDDVLFNIDDKTEIEKIANKHINTSIIKSLSKNNTFEKTITLIDKRDATAHIKLIHKPLPCMYPHCIFQIAINGVIVTKDNYSITLKPKKYKNIRRDIRLELTSIIYSSIIDNDLETEIITDL